MRETARNLNLIDLECDYVGETPDAILIANPFEDKDSIWLPKSQIEIEYHGHVGSITVTLPEWLAIEKELV